LEDSFEILDSLLKDLRKASELIDGVAQRSHLLEEYLDVSHFIDFAGKALIHVYELCDELYDMEPDFSPEYLRPTLAPVNFTLALDRLQSENEAIRESTIRSFKSNMSDTDAQEFAEACKSGTGFEFAQQWWNKQKKPFIPVMKVYRCLRHNRKYVRYHGAKVLQEIFEVRLWDEEKDDVLIEIADTWFDSWKSSYET
jgi:hypothetical protein